MREKRDLWNIARELYQQRGYSEDLLPKNRNPTKLEGI